MGLDLGAEPPRINFLLAPPHPPGIVRVALKVKTSVKQEPIQREVNAGPFWQAVFSFVGGCDQTRRRTKRAPQERASGGCRTMLRREILKIRFSDNAFYAI